MQSIEHINLDDYYHVDPNQHYNVRHEIIQQAKITHMPNKLEKFNKYKHKLSSWITKGIIRSIEIIYTKNIK